MTRANSLTALKILRALLLSDVMITTFAILIYCLVASTGLFFLSWAVYNERYGIGVRDYFLMVF